MLQCCDGDEEDDEEDKDEEDIIHDGMTLLW
jgi:hypothetical protein